ncbi:MAG: pectate lyase, partial [Patescibacteria group bacterium]|nr:pectate lyase [Patescibacteria group bacterium]
HHNWFSTLCNARMPSNRYGTVHVYNNYFNCPGNDYIVRGRLFSQTLIENNYYDNVNSAWEYDANTSGEPRIKAVGNVLVNTVTPTGGNDNVFTPPYSYTLDDANSVKANVMAGAGCHL